MDKNFEKFKQELVDLYKKYNYELIIKNNCKCGCADSEESPYKVLILDKN